MLRLPVVVICLALYASFPKCCGASGMLPDTPLLVMSEAEGIAQMGLRNTDDQPLLLYTSIVDLPDDTGPSVFALPPIIRVEPGGRQLVRFILEKSPEPLVVQHLKRVRFEGIPAIAPSTGASGTVVRITVRQDLPVVISPKGLDQDPEPWKKLVLRVIDAKLSISNPSPFVIRLSQEVGLLPDTHRVKLLERTYVLPGESFTRPLPVGVNASSLTGVRLFPASPFGFDVAPYDASFTH